MIQRYMRLVHKWVAIVVGIFLFSWTVSGVAMLLPARLPPPAAPTEAVGEYAPTDFRMATISPADAIEALEEAQGGPVQVNWVSLGRVSDTLVYMITADEIGLRLINADSGRPFELNEEAAEHLARQEFPTSAPLKRVELIDQHDLSYPWGSLPAYRFVWADPWRSISTVAVTDGTVFRSDIWTRLRHPVVELHTFEPLTAITKRALVTRLVMIGIGSVATIVALTGYYLALPKRRATSRR